MEKVALSKNVHKNIAWLEIFKITLVSLIFFVLSSANVSPGLYPFKMGLYLALCFLGKNPLILSISYFAMSSLSLITIPNLISSAVCSGLCLLFCLVHTKSHYKINIPLAVLYIIICSLGEIYFFIYDMQYITLVISMGLNIIFMIACMIFLKAWFKRNFSLALNVDEAVCGALILIGIFCGLGCIDFFGIDFARFFGVLFLLAITYIFPIHFSTMLGVVVGLGCALSQGNVVYIALFCCMGLVSAIFKSNTKILSCLSVIFIDVIFGLYFEAFYDYELLSIIMVALACCTFLIVPNKCYDKLKIIFFNQNNNYAYKNFINQNKEVTSRKLLQVSDVFYEMDKVFRKLVKGNLPPDEAKRMIMSELLEVTCENCPNKNKCLRVYGTQMQETFEDLVNMGFEKGKINILDIPSYLTSRCSKINGIVNSLNALLGDYKKYTTVVNNLDSSRILIAEQLNGISRILKNMSGEIKNTIQFDDEKQNKIIEELTYKDVVVNEVAVYEKDKDISEVTLVLKNIDIENPNILKVVQKVCACKMEVVDVQPADISGLMLMSLKSAPKFDIMFGISNQTKNNSEMCGDTYSILKLNDYKYLVAICDGMGSGEKANRASTLAISLIENFYKAGFDNEIILSSVNKLLNLGREDVFSALDVCVVDLKNSIVDFIKVGASVGFIKHIDTTTIIESGALPIGILEEITPKISKTVLDTSDMVVLISDGIADSFESVDNLKDFINNIQNSNPQGVADEILAKAMENSLGVAGDDMTVIVSRIFKRE